ncbi:MAG: hypothetical protein ACRETG_11880 [Steroidobacteraceae bacterium]
METLSEKVTRIEGKHDEVATVVGDHGAALEQYLARVAQLEGFMRRVFPDFPPLSSDSAEGATITVAADAAPSIGEVPA